MPVFPPLSTRTRRSARLREAVANTNLPAKRNLKPIYIYPGLIRMSTNRAVTIDTNCPASLYVSSSQQHASSNIHPSDSCSICLDSFMSARDIIRRLPCDHYFHSRCILSWICAADRCPLCNDPVLKRHDHFTSPSTSSNNQLSAHSAKSSASSPSLHMPNLNPCTLCHTPKSPDSSSQPSSSNLPPVSSAASTPSSPSPVSIPIASIAPPHHSTPPTSLPPQDRTYSFVLHDRARFAHLLGASTSR